MEYLVMALQFMFSGFWQFVGCFILIALIFEGIIRIIMALKGADSCDCDGCCCHDEDDQDNDSE